MNEKELRELLAGNDQVQIANQREWTQPATDAQAKVTVARRKAAAEKVRIDFERIWIDVLEGPDLDVEAKLVPDRNWRADYVHYPTASVIELEGVWAVGQRGEVGRHLRPKGFIEDCEKYATFQALGYDVYRIPTPRLDVEFLRQILTAMRLRHCGSLHRLQRHPRLDSSS